MSPGHMGGGENDFDDLQGCLDASARRKHCHAYAIRSCTLQITLGATAGLDMGWACDSPILFKRFRLL